MVHENECFYTNAKLESMQFDQEVPICRIEIYMQSSIKKKTLFLTFVKIILVPTDNDKSLNISKRYYFM